MAPVSAHTELESSRSNRAEEPSAATGFIGGGYAAAFVAVVLAGWLQASNAPVELVARSALGPLALACLIYILLGTLALHVSVRRSAGRARTMLFGALLALGSGVTFASHGYTAMMLLGAVSASVLYLPQRSSAAVSAIAALVALAAFATRTTLWMALVQAEMTFISGLAFVIVFSRVALSELKARTEVERLARALAETNARLREHAAEVEQLATLRERNRIAREIHDGLGHHLTVVHIQLEAAQTLLTQDPERARAALGKAQKLTHAGLDEVRRSVSLLRDPRTLRPLAEQLSALVEEQRAAGERTELSVQGTPRSLREPAERTLYRAAQEALTNARRHARARQVTVRLSYLEQGKVSLCVEDDGVGTPEASGGFGLVGLRERAALVGGTLSVRSGEGRGFAMELEVPG